MKKLYLVRTNNSFGQILVFLTYPEAEAWVRAATHNDPKDMIECVTQIIVPTIGEGECGYFSVMPD